VANGNGNGGVFWQKFAMWALLALLSGAWIWTRSDLSEGKVERAAIKVTAQADHDDVTRLKEIVPRVERDLAAIKAQNEEILRQRRGESRR